MHPKIGTPLPKPTFTFAVSKYLQMQTKKIQTSTTVNTTNKSVNEDLQTSTLVNTVDETVNTNDKSVNKDLQTSTPVNTVDETVNDDDFIVKKGKRISYTCVLSVDEDLHVETIVNDLIKFNVVENKSDFLRKAIDVYINYNAVCVENKLEQPLIIPVPNGKDGSVYVQPKLLKNSLFKSVSKLPTF